MSGPTTWVDVVLHEHSTLREESLQSIRQQQAVLQFGTAGLAALIGLGVRSRSDPLLATTLLMVLAPAVSALVLAIWAGEVERMVRAGAALRRIETRINRAFDEPWPLGWETLLAAGTPMTRRVHGTHPAFVSLVLIATASSALGAAILVREVSCVAAAAAALGDLAICARMVGWYEQSRRRLDQMGMSQWNPARRRTTIVSRAPRIVRRVAFGLRDDAGGDR